jgi:hypothetical protein
LGIPMSSLGFSNKTMIFLGFPRAKRGEKSWESHVFFRGVRLISGIAH